jgi:aerobic C4-dicarboxylate transport protein
VRGRTVRGLARPLRKAAAAVSLPLSAATEAHPGAEGSAALETDPFNQETPMEATMAAGKGPVRKPFYRSLYVQVITAIVIGVLLGHFYPSVGESMKPLGDGFIKLIKMIIAPIIFCTVVVGIAGMEDMKKVGKTGGLALLYFEIVSTIALVVGLVLVNVLKPGAGMNVDPSTLDTKAIAAYTAPGKMQGTVDFLLNVIPSTVVDAFAKGEILQVLLFSVMFGFALHKFGGRGTLVFDVIEKGSHVLFSIVGMIMKVAPIGAFGAMAFTIGKYGVGTLFSLGKLMGTFYLTCLLFIFVVLGLIARFHGFSIWKFIKYIKEELLIVLGTSSSESVLPRMMAKLENLGARKSVVGLVIPTGYSFNLDGTSIYLTMAAVFIAQATNTPMTLTQELTLLAVLLLTSKGAAGITGSGFIVLAATLSAVGHVPVAGLALILGIDRFMSEARALTNLIGNGVATVVVAKWTGDLDTQRMREQLDNETPAAAEEPEGVLDAVEQHMPVPASR